MNYQNGNISPSIPFKSDQATILISGLLSAQNSINNIHTKKEKNYSSGKVMKASSVYNHTNKVILYKLISYSLNLNLMHEFEFKRDSSKFMKFDSLDSRRIKRPFKEYREKLQEIGNEIIDELAEEENKTNALEDFLTALFKNLKDAIGEEDVEKIEKILQDFLAIDGSSRILVTIDVGSLYQAAKKLREMAKDLSKDFPEAKVIKSNLDYVLSTTKVKRILTYFVNNKPITWGNFFKLEPTGRFTGELDLTLLSKEIVRTK